jgi:hypothetical protein
MSRLAPDRKVIMAERFHRLVGVWLDGLPPVGWEGTSKELADSLEATARRENIAAWVPLTIASVLPAMGPVVTAKGFTLTHRRTKAARLVRVARG